MRLESLPWTFHLSLRVTGADHVPRYGSPFGLLREKHAESPNASQIDILVVIARSPIRR